MILIYLLFLHFVADFLLQSRSMGKNKSIYFSVLLQHITIQFAVIFLGASLVLPPSLALWLSCFNASIHGIIDWHIWRGYKILVFTKLRRTVRELNPNLEASQTEDAIREMGLKWTYWEDHWFYATIGLDQFLHAATLIALYTYLR